MKNILVGVDFSDLSAPLVTLATSVAQAHGAAIHLLHVADPDPDFVGYDTGPQATRDAVAEKHREHHRSLQLLADELRAKNIAADALLVQGPTIEKIVGEAERLGADLIMLGAHNKGLVSRVLLGSVSEGVLHAARIPVLILPVKD